MVSRLDERVPTDVLEDSQEVSCLFQLWEKFFFRLKFSGVDATTAAPQLDGMF